MHFEGKPEVLRRLFEKQHLLDKGDKRHTEIRPLLITLSGSMRGVYGGGQVTALSEFGLTRVFDNTWGNSTGAAINAYFLAGQARLGTSLYYSECTQPHFISLSRFLKGGVAMDVDWLAAVFRGEVGNKRLDQNALRLSPTGFWVVATDVETGKMVLFDGKNTSKDIVEPIRASIAVPGVSHGNVVIHSRSYCDGGCYPLPAQELIARFNPTDILVLANCSRDYRKGQKRVENLLSRFLMRKYTPMIRKLFVSRHERFAEGFVQLRAQTQARVAVLWSDNWVGSYTTDRKILRDAAYRAEDHLSSLLREARAGVS